VVLAALLPARRRGREPPPRLRRRDRRRRAVRVGRARRMAGGRALAGARFAPVVPAEWPPVGRWPARVFAVLAAGPLFTGTYSYALGIAALLGCVRALHAGRTWLAGAPPAAAPRLNPLA